MKAGSDNPLPIGVIAQVDGPVVDISCTALPPLHQALISRLGPSNEVDPQPVIVL
jgi:hypothetical protein